MEIPPVAPPVAPSAPADGAPPRRWRSVARVPTEDIQHPDDRKALKSLQQIAGLDDVVRYLFEYGFERLERISNLSSAVKVSERHFPDLYRRYQRCVRRLGVHPEPPLYIRGGSMNAMTGGVERPYMVLNSGLINAATPAELDHVIGHELGHIRCRHLLYGTLARLLPVMAEQIPVIGSLISGGLSLALMEWYRRAELSCDRFGLLCSQDREASLSIHVKLAGAPYLLYDQISIDAFLAQYEEFESLDQDRLSVLYKLLAQSNMTHPWLVVRAHTLHRWHADGEYERLLSDAPEEEAHLAGVSEAWAAAPETAPQSVEEALKRLAEISQPSGQMLAWLATGPRPPHLLICGEERRGWSQLADLLQTPGADLHMFPIGHADLHAELEMADRVVVPLWAGQLLSATERDFVLQALSGIMGGVYLLLTGMQEVEGTAGEGTAGEGTAGEGTAGEGTAGADEAAELRGRLARFVERLPFPVQVFESAEVLQAQLVADVGWLQTAPATPYARWRARLKVALMAMPPAGQPAPLEEQVLDEEADLALIDARAAMADALAGLRAGLGARLDALGSRAAAECPAAVEAEVQRIARAIPADYLSSLERRLQARATGGLGAAAGGLAASGLDAQGLTGGPEGLPLGGAPRPDPLPPRDPLRAALAVGGVIALLGVAGPGWPLAAGAAMLLGASQLGRQQRERMKKALRSDLEADLSVWLDQVEGALSEGLARLAADVPARLRERLAAQRGAGPEALRLRAWLLAELDRGPDQSEGALV